MTCCGCTNPRTGQYEAGCRACSIREIARGPAYFASMKAGLMTKEYRAQLQALGNEVEAHSEVKAMARNLMSGKVTAPPTTGAQP